MSGQGETPMVETAKVKITFLHEKRPRFRGVPQASATIRSESAGHAIYKGV
jgi:hypothetical protein